MRIITLLTLFTITSLSFRAPGTRTIRIVFHHVIGGQPLELRAPLRTVLGDSITVERFRYYVSNFSMEDGKGNPVKSPSSYFLIDQEDSATQTISISVPTGKLEQVSFLLGVDSIRNVSGIQTGALDPLHGMFWTWNSGYVMAKLEGTCETVQSAGNRFTFHVGGFKPGMNVLKWIHLPLPATDKEIEEIHINADINHWFRGRTELKVAETPVCHSPGQLAMRIADNYQHMFSINSIR